MVVNEITDTTDPNTMSTRPAVPDSNTRDGDGDRKVEREDEDEKGRRASESVALSSNDDGGDKDIRHAYIVPKPAPPSPNHVPPPPDERRPPPSVPLKGEEDDQKSSGHTDEAAMHLERPPSSQDGCRTTRRRTERAKERR
ncbi:hypothetical protein PAXINDRAFT_20112 [Paxillus involutus ATCC 200175]|uniref:Uncharacterized protein n=1 Tax=Paxillus involutus ATCC 200175 TaxID=664439 RepID=A0A0C9T5Y7_PAXIN|nr:hypothetical protein PAXINDRAFT_20112 [Paxillus involutus ATCC 200175]